MLGQLANMHLAKLTKCAAIPSDQRDCHGTLQQAKYYFHTNHHLAIKLPSSVTRLLKPNDS